jgi:hypothetical protein
MRGGSQLDIEVRGSFNALVNDYSNARLVRHSYVVCLSSGCGF